MTFKVKNKPSSNIYFENLFNYHDIDWTAVYMLPRLVTQNNYMRSFQCKILNNILYLNKILHIFGIKSTPLCSFCNLFDETPCHIFYECDMEFCIVVVFCFYYCFIFLIFHLQVFFFCCCFCFCFFFL